MQKILRCFLWTPGEPIFLPLTIIRIAYGLFFAASGFNKLFVEQNRLAMLKTITDVGVPFPEFMAVFVSCCEFGGGLLLALGLASRFSAAILMVISVVALLTVGIHAIPPGLTFIAWYSWLLYLPEALYILLSAMICVQGGGPYSLDRRLYRRLTASKET